MTPAQNLGVSTPNPPRIDAYGIQWGHWAQSHFSNTFTVGLDRRPLHGEGRISSNYDFLIPSRPILQNTKSHLDVQRTHLVFIYRISLDVKNAFLTFLCFELFFIF